MPFLRFLTWMCIYHMKVLLSHRTIIIIVSGYTLDRNSSMEKPDQRDWFPKSFCENPSLYLTRTSVPELMYLVDI